MIPLMIPNLGGNEARYLQECVDTNFVSSVGPFVERFETMIAEASGAERAVATSAGTAGLHVALLSVGVEPGDLVIVPSYSFIATANAISYCKAAPWFLDISEDHWTLDADQLAHALKTQTVKRDGGVYHKDTHQRVAAIMPVYANGLPADMDRIAAVAADYALPLVADGAAAIGATYKGRSLANIGADLTVFSFNGNKTVTAGGGGGVVGFDPALLDQVRHLSTTARCGDDYDHDQVGFNYRMTNIAAAVGCAQMEQLDQFVQTKRKIARAYNEGLSDIAGVEPFPQPDWAQGSCWVSGVVINPPIKPIEQVVENLREGGIAARVYWKPLHLQRPYRGALCGPLEVAERIWKRVLVLPSSTSLTQDDIEGIIAIARKALTD